MLIKTFFDFCSGIGGGRLGLEQCGLKCVGYADTSRLSVATYKLLFDTEDEHNYGNIRKIKVENLPDFDILIAGFPCQSFSVIGRKEGLEDPRGQLIYHIAQIMSYKKPKFFILENVKGLVSHHKGKTLSEILNLLGQCGYDTIYKVLSSIDYGVPQMRQRVYFIGSLKTNNLNIANFRWPTKVATPPLEDYLTGDKKLSDIYYDGFKHYLANNTNLGKHTPDDFLKQENLVIDTRMSDLRLYEGRVPTLRSQRDGILYIKNGQYMDLSGYEALLLQGFPKEYAKKAKGVISNRHLLMQAGNAMTVSVINKLGQAIIDFSKTETLKRGVNMQNWEQYEEECADYLGLKYPKAEFIVTGRADSTKSDILAKYKSKLTYIEAKEPDAQCGQFVVFPDVDNKTFIFSPRNKSPKVKAQPFIDYMTNYYAAFVNLDTSGAEININKQYIYEWIMYYYKTIKKAKFVITGYYGNHIVFPIESFPKYFDVKAVYRVKKSGSRNVPQTKLNSIQDTLLMLKSVESCYFENGKAYVNADNSLAKSKYTIGNDIFYFSPESDRKFVLKQLSNTANANVIFSITLKSEQIADDFIIFNDYFK